MVEPPRQVLPLLFVSALAGCGDPNVYVEPPPPTVTVSRPVQRTITDYLQYTGLTEAFEEVDIRARVRGFLQRIEFAEGDYVEAGDLLFVIEQEEYEAEVARANAAIDQAKAQLELAEATLSRMEAAGEKNAVSVLDVLESKAERDKSAADVTAREADLIRAELDLSYTEIRAPIAGLAGKAEVDVGNLVGASEATLLTKIVQFDPMYASFDVPERDVLDLVKEENPKEDRSREARIAAIRAIQVELGVANEDGYSHHGNMQYVDQELDTGTGTLLLRAEFPNPFPPQLFPGLFVRVRIPRDDREALLVPESAFAADQGGQYLLVVDKANKVEQRYVETGARHDGMLVVEKGIDAEDRVIVVGILRARPGARVNPEEAKPTEPATSGVDSES